METRRFQSFLKFPRYKSIINYITIPLSYFIRTIRSYFINFINFILEPFKMFTLRKPNDNPEVDFVVSHQGITMYSKRFETPKYLEWDIKGKCPKCKSKDADIDFYVNGEGIQLFSSRLTKGRWISFDITSKLPDSCYFRVRMKGQTYTIPYERKDIDNKELSEIMSKALGDSYDEVYSYTQKNEEKMEKDTLQEDTSEIIRVDTIETPKME